MGPSIMIFPCRCKRSKNWTHSSLENSRHSSARRRRAASTCSWTLFSIMKRPRNLEKSWHRWRSYLGFFITSSSSSSDGGGGVIIFLVVVAVGLLRGGRTPLYFCSVANLRSRGERAIAAGDFRNFLGVRLVVIIIVVIARRRLVFIRGGKLHVRV